MKDIFPEFFRPAASEFKNLWANCLFVFDTNILMNQYRYSSEAREEWFRILERLRNQIWIPHQVGVEFFRNRPQEIWLQREVYLSTIKTLNDLIAKFEQESKHPFVTPQNLAKLKEVANDIDKELTPVVNQFEHQLTDDPIMERLAELFLGRVGPALPDQQLAEICKNGALRYSKKIPPGYMDCDKNAGDDQYGDLIIWELLQIKAREDKTNVILITGDQKEDWWLRKGGKTIGPRPELIKEFSIATQKSFYMYTAEMFLTNAANFLKINLDVSIEEVKGLQEEPPSVQVYDEKALLMETLSPATFRLMQAKIHSLRKSLNGIDERLLLVNDQISQIKEGNAREADIPLETLLMDFDRCLVRRKDLKEQLDKLEAMRENFMSPWTE